MSRRRGGGAGRGPPSRRDEATTASRGAAWCALTSGGAMRDLDEMGPVDYIVASGRTLQPGSTAVLMVYENLWAAPLAVALRRAGAHLVATGRIPIQGILAALDDLDAAASPEPAPAQRG